MFHTYHFFHRNEIALAALFLAAKVEEQPRKLEHVIKMAHICLKGKDAPPLDPRLLKLISQMLNHFFDRDNYNYPCSDYSFLTMVNDVATSYYIAYAPHE